MFWYFRLQNGVDKPDSTWKDFQILGFQMTVTVVLKSRIIVSYCRSNYSVRYVKGNFGPQISSKKLKASNTTRSFLNKT